MKTLIQLKTILSNLLIAVFFILLASGCELTETESECDKTKRDPIELIIIPDVYVAYKNLEPLSYYDVKFEVYKEYCSNDLSGMFSRIAETDDEGRVSYRYSYNYKFANTKDKVYFKYIIQQGKDPNNPTLPHKEYVIDGEITYDDVVSYPPHFIENTYACEMFIDYFGRSTFILPWNLEDVNFGE